jgi:hypothetical protein
MARKRSVKMTAKRSFAAATPSCPPGLESRDFTRSCGPQLASPVTLWAVSMRRKTPFGDGPFQYSKLDGGFRLRSRYESNNHHQPGYPVSRPNSHRQPKFVSTSWVDYIVDLPSIRAGRLKAEIASQCFWFSLWSSLLVSSSHSESDGLRTSSHSGCRRAEDSRVTTSPTA